MKTPQIAKTKHVRPSAAAFKCQQIDMFQDFLYNTPEQLESLSNSIPLWDCLPKYVISRQTAHKLRKNAQLPPMLKLRCQHFKKWFAVKIFPARISDENDRITEYYPSATEELVEDVLRRISTLQDYGFYKDGGPKLRSSGVAFTISQLREELRKHGHSRSHKEIVQSLDILAKSIIEIRTEGEGDSGYIVSPYFTQLQAVSRTDFRNDPHAKWYVEFHPLITQAIGTMIGYRQYNYSLMMSHSTQLARWINKYLVIKFTFAHIGIKFDLHFSTVKRDSALLESYGRLIDARNAVKLALEELRNNGLLLSFTVEKPSNQGRKVEDVIYSLYPSPAFVAEIKAANRREKDSQKMLEKPISAIEPGGLAHTRRRKSGGLAHASLEV